MRDDVGSKTRLDIVVKRGNGVENISVSDEDDIDLMQLWLDVKLKLLKLQQNLDMLKGADDF